MVRSYWDHVLRHHNGRWQLVSIVQSSPTVDGCRDLATIRVMRSHHLVLGQFNLMSHMSPHY